jgi:GNAT superfamily N-acetyltransferase
MGSSGNFRGDIGRHSAALDRDEQPILTMLDQIAAFVGTIEAVASLTRPSPSSTIRSRPGRFNRLAMPGATASAMSRELNDIGIRFAALDDAGLLLQLIRDLAAYERAPDAVVATEEDLRRYGLGPERQFEALLAFLDGDPAGFALFHPRFSTWLGRPGVYLEDLFVTQAARGKGVGRRLMTRLAVIAVERGWERIDFQVLDWNPARGFYRRLGIEHLGGWLRYGGDVAALRRLAAEDLPDRS